MVIEELHDGRYRYKRVLGSGGMGNVYLMQDTRVSRQVAIKVLRAEAGLYLDDDKPNDAIRLFQREAKAIAALDHPNILPLYDFGEETRDEITITYMVMPYCVDGSLEAWLRQRTGQPLSPQQIAYLVEQAADALQYAHEHQMIHLDVKPSNFLLRAHKKDPLRPTLLLADFGIARNFTTVSSSSRTIRGTPTSMAPEQWSGEPVFASDQYALAVMAYELLAGRPPFTGSMEQLMYKHFSVQPPPPSKFNPRLPAALDSVLLRALAKKPEERYPSIADFASAFTEAAQQPSAVSEQSNPGDVASYATLAISQSEADAGISRLFTLPDGLQVTVPIPAGARDGQIIRLPASDGTSKQAGEILVNIAIKQPEEPQAPDETPRAEPSQPPDETPRAEFAHDTPRPEQREAVQLLDEHDLPTLISSRSIEQMTVPPAPVPEKRRSRRFGFIALISLFVVLGLVAGMIYFSASRSPVNTVRHSITPTATRPAPTVTPTSLPGLYIAGNYNGSMSDSTRGQISLISVELLQDKGYAPLRGVFTFKSPTQASYALSGTVDLQGGFSFTVQPTGQPPLYFYGTVQQNPGGEYLHGNYCNGTGPCQTPAGYFTVGPRY